MGSALQDAYRKSVKTPQKEEIECEPLPENIEAVAKEIVDAASKIHRA
jgi:hypothetical protein